MTLDPIIINSPIDNEVAYSAITSNFTTLVDLETAYTYRGMMIINATDVDIVLNFRNENLEEDFPVNYPPGAYVFDEFRHNGVIGIKYKSDAPTSGFFKKVSWRGE